MGAQGAGKGTQAERIAPMFHLSHLSTGELFRSAVAAETALGAIAKGFLDRGELVPDDITIELVDERLAFLAALRASGDGLRGALFDGFPRTDAQAHGLDVALAVRDERVSKVVEISVPRDRLVSRLSGRLVCPNDGLTYHLVFNPPKAAYVCDRCGTTLTQRADDTPEAIEKRLSIYFAQTEPLLEYYRSRGLLVVVDGDAEIDVVTESIARVLEDAGLTR